MRKELQSKLDEPVELVICGQSGRIICAYLNDFRIAGGKPWGGGSTVHKWSTTLREVIRAFPPLYRALEMDYLGRSAEERAHPNPSEKDAMHEARKAWWNSTCRRGDPKRMPNLAFEAFEAGWNTRPLTGGVTEVTDAMIEAGCEAMSKVHAAMRDRNLSDEPETMDDFDEGDVCRAIYLAMSNVSRGVK